MYNICIHLNIKFSIKVRDKTAECEKKCDVAESFRMREIKEIKII